MTRPIRCTSFMPSFLNTEHRLSEQNPMPCAPLIHRYACQCQYETTASHLVGRDPEKTIIDHARLGSCCSKQEFQAA